MPHDNFDIDEEGEKLSESQPKEEDKEDEGGEGPEGSKRKRKRKRKKKSGNTAESSESSNNTDKTECGGGLDKLNSLEHTVYVEGIPFVCTEDQVKDFFVSNGCEDVLQMRLPT